MKSKLIPIMLILACIILLGTAESAKCYHKEQAKGQLLYVPVYSHIYVGDSDRPFLLSITLSIRNTSLTKSLRIVSIDYYDTEGKLLEKYIDKPQEIKPFSSMRQFIKQSNKKGGAGAKFLVRWESDSMVSVPVIEAVMIGAASQQGISFTSRGKVLEDN